MTEQGTVRTPEDTETLQRSPATSARSPASESFRPDIEESSCGRHSFSGRFARWNTEALLAASSASMCSCVLSGCRSPVSAQATELKNRTHRPRRPDSPPHGYRLLQCLSDAYCYQCLAFHCTLAHRQIHFSRVSICDSAVRQQLLVRDNWNQFIAATRKPVIPFFLRGLSQWRTVLPSVANALDLAFYRGGRSLP